MKYLFVFFVVLTLVIIVNAKTFKSVRLISPKSHERVKKIRPILRWQKYGDAHFYLLQWYEVDPVTRSTINAKYNIVTPKTEYQFKEDLIPNKVYCWQLQALDADKKPITRIMAWNFITGSITKEKVEKLKREFYRKVKEIGEKLGGISVHNFARGVNIVKVKKNSVAEKKGLKKLDIIFECNGQPVRSINDLYALMQHEKNSVKIERRIDFSKK